MWENKKTCRYIFDSSKIWYYREYNGADILNMLLAKFEGFIIDRSILCSIINCYKKALNCIETCSKKIAIAPQIQKVLTNDNTTFLKILNVEQRVLNRLLDKFNGYSINKELLLDLIEEYENLNAYHKIVIDKPEQCFSATMAIRTITPYIALKQMRKSGILKSSKPTNILSHPLKSKVKLVEQSNSKGPKIKTKP